MAGPKAKAPAKGAGEAAREPKPPESKAPETSEVEALRAELAVSAELLEAAGVQAEADARRIKANGVECDRLSALLDDARGQMKDFATGEFEPIRAPRPETQPCEILKPVWVSGAQRKVGAVVELTEFQFDSLPEGSAKTRH